MEKLWAIVAPSKWDGVALNNKIWAQEAPSPGYSLFGPKGHIRMTFSIMVKFFHYFQKGEDKLANHNT